MYHQFNIQQFYVLSAQCICFLWVWEQTAVISLYSIKWLVYITETACVHCAVRVESLNTNQVSFQKSGGPAMSQAVSRRSLTAAGVVRFRINPCEACDRRSGRGPGFAHSTSVLPVRSFQQRPIPIFIYMLLWPEEQTGEARKLPKIHGISEMGCIRYKSTFSFCL